MVVQTIGKPKEPATIANHFRELPDPRKGTLRYHKFIDIIVITICAVTSGADDYIAIAGYGKAKEAWFKEFLELPNGIPSHDTFWRVFEALEPERFQKCFMKWVSSIRKSGFKEVIALDGKLEGELKLARSLKYLISSQSCGSRGCKAIRCLRY